MAARPVDEPDRLVNSAQPGDVAGDDLHRGARLYEACDMRRDGDVGWLQSGLRAGRGSPALSQSSIARGTPLAWSRTVISPLMQARALPGQKNASVLIQRGPDGTCAA
jgi:hypothetical protein